ncbi:hypothetical protein A3Q56_03945 [Intoshia linei]|uniref:Transmembrane protein n=1 Tax=Intoshia linei TaxID=1819745 RepID=A0A177B215_9BILA|nr:hypothetical protein A3Q56_03945 [Intoshia linei]
MLISDSYRKFTWTNILGRCIPLSKLKAPRIRKFSQKIEKTNESVDIHKQDWKNPEIIKLTLAHQKLNHAYQRKGFKKLQKRINYKYLDLSDNGITDLSKFDFESVTSMNLKLNYIKSLKVLPKMKNLMWLDLRDNAIESLKGLKSLINLKYLDLRGNQVQFNDQNYRKNQLLMFLLYKLKKLYFNSQIISRYFQKQVEISKLKKYTLVYEYSNKSKKLIIRASALSQLFFWINFGLLYKTLGKKSKIDDGHENDKKWNSPLFYSCIVYGSYIIGAGIFMGLSILLRRTVTNMSISNNLKMIEMKTYGALMGKRIVKIPLKDLSFNSTRFIYTQNVWAERPNDFFYLLFNKDEKNFINANVFDQVICMNRKLKK